MQERLTDWLRSFLPAPLGITPRQWLRAVVGVGLVVLPMVAIGLVLFGGPVTLHIVAPAGASAVILFSASSSPFAQPWSVIGGNLIAVAIGVSLGLIGLSPVAAAVAAVCLAIACLFLLRCMHPPSCALAMVAAIGGPGITELGYGLLYPVAFNSLLLVTFALLYNNLTGHPYPKPRNAAPGAAAGSVSLGEEQPLQFTHDDVERALADFGEYVDVTREDLVELIQRTEKHAIRRSMGTVTAADIMCHDLHSCAPEDSVGHARALVRRHRLHALAVLEPGTERLVGIVTQTDLLQHTGSRAARFSLRRTPRPGARVEAIMSAPVVSVREDAHLPDLVHLLADRSMTCLPVTDQAERLVGMITQGDLVAGLYQSWMKRLGG